MISAADRGSISRPTAWGQAFRLEFGPLKGKYRNIEKRRLEKVAQSPSEE